MLYVNEGNFFAFLFYLPDIYVFKDTTNFYTLPCSKTCVNELIALKVKEHGEVDY